MSICSFSHSVFKRLVLQTCKNQGFFLERVNPVANYHQFILYQCKEVRQTPAHSFTPKKVMSNLYYSNNMFFSTGACSWRSGARCYPGTCEGNMLLASDCKCADGFTNHGDCDTCKYPYFVYKYTELQKKRCNFDNSLRCEKQSIYFFSLNYKFLLQHKVLVLITKS